MATGYVRDCVVLSVSGKHGPDVAEKSFEADVQSSAPTSLQSLHGSHGLDGRDPVAGQPGGHLALSVSESNITSGGIHIQITDQVSGNNQLPEHHHISSTRNIKLTAAGGRGESGHNGTDGEPGRSGLKGSAATQYIDAGQGGSGGDGGNGGRGTSGANGGQGGSIRVFVDENQTHLLMCITCDVSGGQGGDPGAHGQPGQGGAGGEGGEPFTWQEHDKSEFICTDHCVGAAVRGESQTGLARGNVGAIFTDQIADQILRQAGSGSKVQTWVAKASQQYRRVSGTSTRIGACRCNGGESHCTNCEERPSYRTRLRSKGLPGEQGKIGGVRTEQLVRGSQGNRGSAEFIVRSRGSKSSTMHYKTIYSLELVSFDVEDENDDGIFEPGECFYIRRVCIRNKGGMPSPPGPIPITVQQSPFVSAVNDPASVLNISVSIPAGRSLVLDGELRARISPLGVQYLQCEPLEQTTQVTLSATMPWIDRPLGDFSFARTITTRFPIRLENIRHLKSIRPGDAVELECKVTNIGSLRFKSDPRAAVEIALPARTGVLHGATEQNNRVILPIPLLDARSSQRLSYGIDVSPNAECYGNVDASITLYMPAAGNVPLEKHTETSTSTASSRVRAVQKLMVEFQVAAAYSGLEDSDVLVLTNPGTNLVQLRALRNLIEYELKLKMNIWNLGLYNGLENLDEIDGSQESSNILIRAVRQSVLVLCNKFDTAHRGSQSALQYFDVHTTARACYEGASLLFLGAALDTSFQDLQIHASFPIDISATSIADLKQLAIPADSIESLVQMISQATEAGGERFHTYWVQTRESSSPFQKKHINKTLKRLKKLLKNTLPNERFLLCTTSEKGDKILIVFHGLPRHASISATRLPEPPSSSARQSSSLYSPAASGNHLDPVDQYAIISSLPIAKRAELLWSSGSRVEPFSSSILEMVTVSLIEEIQDEISSALVCGAVTNPLPDDDPNLAHRALIAAHFPRTSTILYHTCKQHVSIIPTQILRLLNHVAAVLAAPPRQRSRLFGSSSSSSIGGRGGSATRVPLRTSLRLALDAYLSDLPFQWDKHRLREFHDAADSLQTTWAKRSNENGGVWASGTDMDQAVKPGEAAVEYAINTLTRLPPLIYHQRLTRLRDTTLQVRVCGAENGKVGGGKGTDRESQDGLVEWAKMLEFAAARRRQLDEWKAQTQGQVLARASNVL